MSSKTEAHSNKATSKQQPPQRIIPEPNALEPEGLPKTTVQHARHDPSLLTPANLIQLQDTIGNRAVAGFLNEISQRESSVQQESVQRIIELPEMEITGDPHFYTRAQRRNQYWAANSPRPGWPYDETLREFWSREAFDDFADAVRDYQIDVMGDTLQEADGILGPQTATSLEIHPIRSRTIEGEPSQEEEETATGETAEPGRTLLDPREAEIGEVPEWIMAYASDTPWPVHSAVYAEAMASGGIGIEGAAETWEGFLDQMGEMNFLGHTVVGHTAFLRRLDIAQRFLRANHPDIPERQLVTSVGEPGDRSQWRAAERLTASPHLFGMAIDINAAQNPWMSNPDEAERSTLYAWIIWRATWLMGRGTPVTPAESHQRAGSRSPASRQEEPQSTEAIWEYFNEANQATLSYLNLVGNREAVADRLRLLGEPPSAPGPVEVRGQTFIGEYVPADIPLERLSQGLAAIDDWIRVIEYDRNEWPNRGPNDTVRGFMNLRRELVVALRDHGGLQWGACDLGETQSGDMMHFALDPPQIFRFRNQVRQRLQIARREMSREEYGREQQAERTRRNEMARHGREERRRARR